MGDVPILRPREEYALTRAQAQRMECLRIARQLVPVATFDNIWVLAIWLYDGDLVEVV